MPSSKDLKKRIDSIKGTQQITKAMKMVSAAKLRRAQEAIAHHRPYAKGLRSLVEKTAHEVSHDRAALKELSLLRFQEEATTPLSCAGKQLYCVVISSDRGLCGAFNSNILKTFYRWFSKARLEYQTAKIIVIGKKGNEFLRRTNEHNTLYWKDITGTPSYSKIHDLADYLIKIYEQDPCTDIVVIYNHFTNALVQKPTIYPLLPITIQQIAPHALDGTVDHRHEIYFYPNPKDILKDLMKKVFEVELLHAFLESHASEYGARMSAMESATKNSNTVIKRLTLAYNKQRQGAITKELMEIIAGTESQNVDV